MIKVYVERGECDLLDIKIEKGKQFRMKCEKLWII